MSLIYSRELIIKMINLLLQLLLLRQIRSKEGEIKPNGLRPQLIEDW